MAWHAGLMAAVLLNLLCWIAEQKVLLPEGASHWPFRKMGFTSCRIYSLQSLLHGIFAAASRILCGSYDKHSASTDGSVLCLWLGQPQAEGRFVLWYLFISLASDQSDLFPGASDEGEPYTPFCVLFSVFSDTGSNVVVCS